MTALGPQVAGGPRPRDWLLVGAVPHENLMWKLHLVFIPFPGQFSGAARDRANSGSSDGFPIRQALVRIIAALASNQGFLGLLMTCGPR